MKSFLLSSKYRLLILSALILIAASYFVWTALSPDEEAYQTVSFTVKASDDEAHAVSLWKNGGVCYLFLPSYADMNNLSLETPPHTEVLFNDSPVREDSFAGVEWNKEYRLTVDGTTYPIIFLRSENVAAMYLDTDRPSVMKKVNADKEHKGSIALSLIEADGQITYVNRNYEDTVKGRGNSTWDYDKKPYAITLKNPAALIDGNENCRYVLLANYIDPSNLRNKLVYDLAADVCPTWNVSSRFVDLYVNGAYRGLYLLTDKIEVSENRVRLPQNSFFINLELDERADDESVVAKVLPHSSAELKNADSFTREERAAAGAEIEAIFAGLVNHTISDDQLDRVIDLDSWAMAYIFDEFSSNYDAGLCSLYFYLNDGKLYGGPLWDFDNTFGVTDMFQADGFCASIGRFSALWPYMTSYASFNDRVSVLYETAFLPAVNRLIDGGFETLSASVRAANHSDHVRWHSAGESGSADSDSAALFDYIVTRRGFLNSAWIDKTPFCFVGVQKGGTNRYFSFPENTPGEVVRQRLEDEYSADTISSLIDRETGGSYDYSVPLTRHVKLSTKNGAQQAVGIRQRIGALLVYVQSSINDLTVYVFCALFCVLGLTFLAIDIHRQKKSGKTQ